MLGAAIVFLLASVGIGSVLFAPGAPERYGSALDAGFVACVVAFVTCSVLAIASWARLAVQGPVPRKQRFVLSKWRRARREALSDAVASLRDGVMRWSNSRMPD